MIQKGIKGYYPDIEGVIQYYSDIAGDRGTIMK